MPLPAPYAPPWKRLGEDGVALLAWLGLKGRELWRRNREGTLPVPGFWPRRWSRLFWPLVLAALLLGAGLAGRAWLSQSAAGPAEGTLLSPPLSRGAEAGGSPADGTTGALTGKDKPLGTEPSLGGDRPLGPAPSRDTTTPFALTPDRDGGRTAPGDGSAGAPPEAATARSADALTKPAGRARWGKGGEGPAADSGQAPADGAAESPGGQATPSAASPLAAAPPSPLAGAAPLAPTPESPEDEEANRLRAAWSAVDPEPLIAAFRPEAATATLTLALDDAFIALQALERQRQAERWQHRAAEAGYSHLRLRDGRGRLLAREALVGGGMVVLEPPGEGPEAP